jgi:hypothetical protein
MTTTKTAKKKAPKKAAKTDSPKQPTKERLPDVQQTLLPRGQTRLPNGRIQLKTGPHDLAAGRYDVHGAELELQGKVFVAGKNVEWINVGCCPKCNAIRSEGIKINKLGDLVVVLLRCSNDGCLVGHHTYIQVHDARRILVP